MKDIACIATLGQQNYFGFLEQHAKSDFFQGAHLHHIVPRWIFKRCEVDGLDDPDNLCWLTPRQHLTAHWKLVYCFEEGSQDWVSAVCALHYLSYRHEVTRFISQDERDNINALRGKANEVINKYARSKEQYEKIAQALRGRKYNYRNKGRLGQSHTIEACKKISNAKKGTKLYCHPTLKSRFFVPGTEEPGYVLGRKYTL